MSTWIYVDECKRHLLELCAAVVPYKRVDFLPGLEATVPPSLEDIANFWEDVIRSYDTHADEVLNMFRSHRETAIRYLGLTPSRRSRIKIADSQRLALSASALWYGRRAAMRLARSAGNGNLRGGLAYRVATENAAYAAAFGEPRKQQLQFFPVFDYELDLPVRMRERWCWDLDEADPLMHSWD